MEAIKGRPSIARKRKKEIRFFIFILLIKYEEIYVSR